VARDPYQILGIARDATIDQAMAAYKRLAEIFHPDRLQDRREEVQAEGAARMREATDAIRTLRARLRRPLVAPGHKHDDDVTGRSTEPRTVVRAGTAGDRVGVVSPSDSATEAEARLYDVELHAVDGPPLHVRWGGAHAAATLAALRHAHRVEGGPIKQVEWGTYEVLLEGAATRRLLRGVLPEDEWGEQPAVVVRLGDQARSALPVRPGQDGRGVVALRSVLELLDDSSWYRVLADVY
jgi:hypothetical protein